MKKGNVEDVTEYIINKKEYEKYFNNQIISKKEYDNFCREKSRSREVF